MFMKYLALLRGINVGGNNIIKKDDLTLLFESVGCQSVLTYIQSGNILCSSKKSKTSLQDAIENALKKKLGTRIPTVLYTENEYKKMLEQIPKNWNQNPSKKYNALFLLDGISTKKAKASLPDIQPQYEEVSYAPGVIFWSCSKNTYTKTTYAKHLAKSPLYKLVTIRNGNTTLKLKELFDSIES